MEKSECVNLFGGRYIFFNNPVLLCLHVFIYQEDINLTNTEFVFVGTCRGPCNRTLFRDYPVSSKYFYKNKIMIQINPSCITQALMFHNILFISNKSTCQNLLFCSDKVTHFPSGIQSSDANRNLQSGQNIN